MGLDDSLVGRRTFDHRYIPTGLLSQLLLDVSLLGDTVITISDVTGNLRIHRSLADGRPGAMIGVINLAREDVEWYDGDADGGPPSP